MKKPKFLKNLLDAKTMINESDHGELLIEVKGDLLKLLQGTLLEMLRDVLNVCAKHDIPVFLCGGTTLGSIRHQGFIPWDDDVDIGMLREDYPRFIAAFEEDLSDRYILNAPNYSPDAITRFPKILKKDSFMDTGESKNPDHCKVFLDIFLADRIPDQPLRRKLKGLRCNLLEYIAGQVAFVERLDDVSKKLYQSGGKTGYYIRLTIGRLFSLRKAAQWNDRIDACVQYHGKRWSSYGLTTGSKHYFGEIFPAAAYLPVKTAVFEGMCVPVMNDVERYLTNLYGDYMQIPPPEKRQRHFVRKLEL